MIFISVDLPAPFSPTNPWISPASREKSTLRKAATPPKVLVMPDSSSSAGAFKSVGAVKSDTGRSDQEVFLHPHHARSIRLGDDRPVNHDVLRDAAGTGLLAGHH